MRLIIPALFSSMLASTAMVGIMTPTMPDYWFPEPSAPTVPQSDYAKPGIN